MIEDVLFILFVWFCTSVIFVSFWSWLFNDERER